MSRNLEYGRGGIDLTQVSPAGLEIKRQVREQIHFSQRHGLGLPEERWIFYRLIFALRHAQDGHLGMLSNIEFCRTNQVADIFNHHQVKLLERQVAERIMHQLGLQVAGAAGQQLADPAVQPGQALGIMRGFDVALQHGKPACF